MKDKQGTSRRDFLKTCAIATAAVGAGEALSFAEAAAPKSKVVVATDSALHGADSTVDPTRIRALLDRAMQSFFESKNWVEPWKQLVRPGQVVGLKVNTIAGRGLSTNVPLVEAITERLQQAGIKPFDIVIWDRTKRELERAGFKLSQEPGKVRCIGTDEIGYEDAAENFGAASCRLSKLLTQTCDVVINLPLLKDHGGAGLTLSMKNMYGVINNPDKCHANGCNPGVADVNMLPTIRKKIIFTIADATTACYDGGPGYKPEYVWKHNSLIVARDPVALDHTGWQIIESKRSEKGLKTLEAAGRPPRYIATAADGQHRLGTDDPKRMMVVQV